MPSKHPARQPATIKPISLGVLFTALCIGLFAWMPSAFAQAAARAKSAPAIGQWISHNDPSGFSLNSPSNWNVRTDRNEGRIDIEGPEGQKAVIWPMFVRGQQLDARGAGVVLLQLARRVDARMAWGAPQLAGDAVRIFARGQSHGTAVLHWSSSPEGTAANLFCVTAPAAVYQTSADTFAGILKSFHVNPDPKAASGAPEKSTPAVEQVAWVRWTDPREGAFGASVPQGWTVSGGAFRQSATDIRKGVLLLSPDHQIRMTVGDANVGVFTAPNAMYGGVGMREGSYTTLGDGSRLQIRRFVPAQQFVREYVSSAVRRECGEPRMISENERPDLAASAVQQARAQGAPNPRATAGGVSFSCNWNGQETRGYYATATVLPFPNRNGIWYVDALYGYIAVPERQQQADDISRHVLNSMGINAQWKQREDQIASNAVQQDNARSQEIQSRARQAIANNQRQTSDMIVNGHAARSQTYDEISRKRENSVLGTVDVVDPSSGRQYKIDNYSDYHWMNNLSPAPGQTHPPALTGAS